IARSFELKESRRRSATRPAIATRLIQFMKVSDMSASGHRIPRLTIGPRPGSRCDEAHITHDSRQGGVCKAHTSVNELISQQAVTGRNNATPSQFVRLSLHS